MCEKRTRKVKKGSHITRLREARRLQRLQYLGAPVPPRVEPIPLPRFQPQPIDRAAQNRVILELALKTIALMHKNRLIQQKIIDLQKETSEFVASVMNNPQNRPQQVHLFGGVPVPVQVQPPVVENKNPVLKVEPDV